MSSNKEFKIDDLPAPDETFFSAEDLPAPDKAPISKLESSIRGGAQGLAYGSADEITAGIQHPIEGVMQMAKLMGMDISPESVAGYTGARDESRAAYDAAQKENPMSYLGGELAGGILPAIAGTALSGGLGAPAAVGQTASAISALQKLKAVAGAGAAMGAATGLGSSTAETGSELAGDVGMGAATGLATGTALHGTGKLLGSLAGKVAPKLKSKAELMMASALGANKKDFKENDIREIGRMAIDEGIASPMSSTETMLQKVQDLIKKAQNSRQTIYDDIDKAGASTFSPSEAAMKAESKITGNLNPKHLDAQETIAKLEPSLENILSRGDGNISMNEAQALVKKLGDAANFDSTRSSESNKIALSVRDSLRQYLNDAVETGTNNIDLKKAVQLANKQMSKSYKIEELLTNKLAGETAKKVSIAPTLDELAIAAVRPDLSIGKYAVRQAYNRIGGGDTIQKTAALAADKAADILSGKSRIADTVLKQTQPFINATSAKYGPDAFLTKALQKIHDNPADMAKKSMMNVLLQSGYSKHLKELITDTEDKEGIEDGSKIK